MAPGDGGSFPAAAYVSRELGDTCVALLGDRMLFDGQAGIPAADPFPPVLVTEVAEEALAWVKDSGARPGRAG